MVSWSCCFSRVVMLMSCDRSSLSYHRSFFAVSICTCLSFLRAPQREAPSSMLQRSQQKTASCAQVRHGTTDTAVC